MKRPLSKISLILVSLIALLGCQKQDLYVKGDDELTNGIITYHHLPDHWYFTGDYSFRIGAVKGGNALFASDENATIVKERKPLFDDMDYAPWIRDDVMLPDLCSDQVEIRINLIEYGTYVLEGQEKDEFIHWFQMYQNGETEEYDLAHTKLRGVISFDSLENQLLCYQITINLIQNDDAYIIVDRANNKAIASFGHESKLYERVKGCLGD